MKEKGTITLTTTRKAEAALAKPRPVRRLRVTPLTSYGGETLYYMNDLSFPVPAWTRRFDGWTVGAVVRLAAGLALAAVAAAWWALRLLGRAR